MIQRQPQKPSTPDLRPTGRLSGKDRASQSSRRESAGNGGSSAAVPTPGGERCPLTVTKFCSIHASVAATGSKALERIAIKDEPLRRQVPAGVMAGTLTGRSNARTRIASCFRVLLGSSRVCLKSGKTTGQTKASGPCAARSGLTFEPGQALEGDLREGWRNLLSASRQARRRGAGSPRAPRACRCQPVSTPRSRAVCHSPCFPVACPRTSCLGQVHTRSQSNYTERLPPAAPSTVHKGGPLSGSQRVSPNQGW